MSAPAPGILHVSSMYGAATRQSIIVLTYDAPGKEFEVQMSIATARNHAQDILEVAESAVADAFIFEWLKTKINASDESAAAVLGEFRIWREKHRE